MTYSTNKNFTPWLFIGIGATQAYFTLRETYLHAIPGDGPQGNASINGVYQGSFEVRSRHIVNLSQDVEEAFKKASDAANSLGYELKADINSLTNEMREIKRATAAERQAREQAEREQEIRWEQERLEREQAQRNMLITEGKYVFGPYRDMEFKQASRGYVTWLVDNISAFEDNSIIKLTAELVKERCAGMILPKPKANIYAGSIGKRQLFKATVLRCIPYDGYYGRTYFTIMVDKDTGACLMSKSGSFSANEGEELEFKATVKEHGDYKGQSQTVVQRISLQ